MSKTVYIVKGNWSDKLVAIFYDEDEFREYYNENIEDLSYFEVKL